MQPDPRKYLWDALQATERLRRFGQGKSFDDYRSNELLKSAVERQFEVVGEALNQLSKVDPVLAGQIPELARIVAFRNILIHGYAMVDDAIVWQVLTDKRPVLERTLRALLAELSDQP